MLNCFLSDIICWFPGTGRFGFLKNGIYSPNHLMITVKVGLLEMAHFGAGIYGFDSGSSLLLLLELDRFGCCCSWKFWLLLELIAVIDSGWNNCASGIDWIYGFYVLLCCCNYKCNCHISACFLSSSRRILGYFLCFSCYHL